MEKVTTDTILNKLQEWVESKVPIPPDQWIDAAAKLNTLRSQDDDLLINLEQTVAQRKYDKLQEGFTSAKAETYVKTLPCWSEMKRQQAKIKIIEETIKIAKKRSQLAIDEQRGY